jgi:hypothetical protein
MYSLIKKIYKLIKMGRSCFFNPREINFPGSLPISDKLSKLVEGGCVWITVGSNSKPMPVCRSVSTYSYKTSSTNEKLIVDSIDYENSIFDGTGERCIVFRDPSIPAEDHIYSWCVTTDGYMRETEGYGISGEVLDIQVVSPDGERDISQVLSSLTPGRKIHLEVDEIPPVSQLPYTPSLLPDDDTSDVNAYWLEVDFVQDGLIALREPQYKKENHVYFWFLRTDGIIVQCDVFEPLFKVKDLYVF